MEFKKMKITLKDEGEGTGLVLNNPELGVSINLENSNSLDLKDFFDKIFEYVVRNEKILEFELESLTDKTLFYNVANDLIKQVNSEIKDSEQNFIKIIGFKENKNDKEDIAFK